MNSTSTLTTVTSSFQDAFPTPPQAEPDDIVYTPGGIAYRSNVFLGTTPNPWPEIREVTVNIGNTIDGASIQYRDYVETNAGQNRNNIFYISKTSEQSIDQHISNIVFTAVGLPVGITANVSFSGYYNGEGIPEPWMQIVSFGISKNIKPGYYEFNMDVQIDGNDYGTVLCIIKVLK
jgi:hypothetical protein